MAQGPYGIDPGDGGFSLEPQGMALRNFFRQGWGPQQPFRPGGGGPGPGPVRNPPMYDTIDGWPAQGPAARTPLDHLLPPASCPQPCPTTVQTNLCVPQGPSAGWDATDPFGDPAEFIPPGVRTVPEYTPTGVKSVPGGSALVGPGGAFVFPTPKLPAEPRGTTVPAGEVVGLPGAVSHGPPGAPSNAIPPHRRGIPWWGWAIAGVVAVRILGGRR